MVLNANDDFPEPETPVKTTNLFFGMSKSIFLRLFSRAPRIFITPLITNVNIEKMSKISIERVKNLLPVLYKTIRHQIANFLSNHPVPMKYQQPEHGPPPV